MLLKESIRFNNNFIIAIFLFLYSFLLLLFCSQFSYILGDFNTWPDVNIYYTIGKSLWFDKIPYKDLFDHKGPIIFFLYGFGYGLTPNSFQGMFLLEVISFFIGSFFVFKLSSLFFNKILSVFSACVYLNCVFYFSAFGGSPEEFILTLMVISLYFFIKQFKTNTSEYSCSRMLIHGILLSITFFIKFNLIVFWFFPLLSIFLNLLLLKDYRSFIKNFCMILFGIVLVTIPILLFFIKNNAFSEFIEAYFTANFIYGNAATSSPLELISRIFVMIYKLLKISFLPTFFIIIGVCYFSFTKLLINYLGRLSIFLSFCFVLVTVFYNINFMSYYFLICLVFVPLGIISVISIFCKFINTKNKYFLCFCLIFVLSTSYSRIKSADFFGYTVQDLKSRNFNLEPIDTFSNIILLSEDKSVISFGLDITIDVFTRARLVPPEKYFFNPNLYPDNYPIIYDNQLNSIRTHSVKFLMMSDNYPLRHIFYNTILESGYIPISKVDVFTLYQYSK